MTKKINKKLLDDIRYSYEQLRRKAQSNWNQDLPFEELLFDRWERAKKLGFGSGSSIYHNSYVYGKVQVGKDTWIGPFTILEGSGELRIGSHCSISAGVQIYTHDSVKWACSEKKAPYSKASVKVGSHCYIGPYAVISKGVSIGKHCVIGAHTLVNKNLPAYSIAYGAPAKIVGKVKLSKKGIATLHYY